MGIHLGVEEAGGSLDNAGQAAVDLHLEDLALGVRHDSLELQNDVLGVHVQDEVEGERLGFAGGDRDVVSHSRQVADHAGRLRSVLGQRLGGPKLATHDRDLNGPILVVGDLDQSSCRPAVDELDAEDVGIGKGRLDVGLELGSCGGLLGSGLEGEVN